jgi:hypothetical protein
MPVHKNSLNNLKKGKKFSSAEQPENRGRRPSALSRFIKESGVSMTDIKLMLGSFIWDHTTTEISALLKDKKNPPPIGVSVVLGALNDDLKTKSLTNLEKLMDRAYGKPTQKDIVEFSDIPDSAKDRLERIFGETQKKSEKIKPKIVSRNTSGKKGKNE